jgi:hypothetical protein
MVLVVHIRARLKKLKTEQRHVPRSLNRDVSPIGGRKGKFLNLESIPQQINNQLLWGITKRLIL